MAAPVVPEVKRTNAASAIPGASGGWELSNRVKRSPFPPGFSKATVLPDWAAPLPSSRIAHNGAVASMLDNSSGFIW